MRLALQARTPVIAPEAKYVRLLSYNFDLLATGQILTVRISTALGTMVAVRGGIFGRIPISFRRYSTASLESRPDLVPNIPLESASIMVFCQSSLAGPVDTFPRCQVFAPIRRLGIVKPVNTPTLQLGNQVFDDILKSARCHCVTKIYRRWAKASGSQVISRSPIFCSLNPSISASSIQF